MTRPGSLPSIFTLASFRDPEWRNCLLNGTLGRKFAAELKQVSLKDLSQLGGWKDPQTILKCYQSADEESMRAALAERRVLRGAVGV